MMMMTMMMMMLMMITMMMAKMWHTSSSWNISDLSVTNQMPLPSVSFTSIVSPDRIVQMSSIKRNILEKSKKCKQCNFATFQAGILRRHFKTHSGEKPNKCNQCDFRSSRASSLKKKPKMHKRLTWFYVFVDDFASLGFTGAPAEIFIHLTITFV